MPPEVIQKASANNLPSNLPGLDLVAANFVNDGSIYPVEVALEGLGVDGKVEFAATMLLQLAKTDLLARASKNESGRSSILDRRMADLVRLFAQRDPEDRPKKPNLTGTINYSHENTTPLQDAARRLIDDGHGDEIHDLFSRITFAQAYKVYGLTGLDLNQCTPEVAASYIAYVATEADTALYIGYGPTEGINKGSDGENNTMKAIAQRGREIHLDNLSQIMATLEDIHDDPSYYSQIAKDIYENGYTEAVVRALRSIISEEELEDFSSVNPALNPYVSNAALLLIMLVRGLDHEFDLDEEDIYGY